MHAPRGSRVFAQFAAAGFDSDSDSDSDTDTNTDTNPESIGNAPSDVHVDASAAAAAAAARVVSADALDGAWLSAAAPMRTSVIEPWPSDMACVGASILAFSVDPHHDRVFFWLCKNRRVLTWGAGSRRWSDFGGVKSLTDVDAPATAAREFWEETAGCVRYFDTDVTRTRKTHDDIAASLRRGEYVLRLETALDLGLFVTFVVQVPWDPRAIQRFDHCRLLLTGLSKRLRRVPLDPPEIDALHGVHDNNSNKTRNSWEQQQQQQQKQKQQQKQQRTREQWLLRHPAVRFSLRPVPRSMCSTGTGTSTSARHDDGVVVLPVVDQVHQAFLEKEAIELWSVPALLRALRYDGILGHKDSYVESLRPSFIPVMSCVLSELIDAFPSHFRCDAASGDAALQFPIVRF